MQTIEKSAAGDAGASESALREKLIDTARDGWTNRLIDLSRRNNLLFYKPVSSGTLELSITPQLMAFLSNGKTLPISDLLANDRDKISSIRAISRKGLENLEEKGLPTLYLALGRCTWTADDGGRDPIAPVLLVPIGLKLKGQDLQATEVELAGETEVNPVLLHVFNRELNISLTDETVLGWLRSTDDTEPARLEDPDREEEEAPVNLQAVLDSLNAMANKLPGFRAEPFAVLGNFSFQKMAMVRDLENRRSELLDNDVVAAIAGDSAARKKLGGSQVETDPTGLDAILPDNEFAVVEADSSQQCAIAGISAGQSAVVHGPPGTGKSQTITNLIATLTARGKKVLFVAEKRAALEVVMSRLTAVGLDHLAIDLHGAEQTPKKVMERVARTLSAVREAVQPASEVVHQQFVDRRDKLNRHVARMHTVHAPVEQTIYAMQGALLRLPSNISSPLRWRGPDLMQITPKRAERVSDLLGEAAGFESLFNRTDLSPWTGVELKDGNGIQKAVDLAARLTYEILPQLTECLNRVCTSSRLRLPKTLAEINELLTVLRQAERILATYVPEVFTESDRLLAAMQPGRSSGIQRVWLTLTNGAYRAAYKRAIELRRGTKASRTVVFGELEEAQKTREHWQRLSGVGAMPTIVPEMEACDRLHQSAQEEIRILESICKASWDGLDLANLSAKIAALSADTTTPYRLNRLYEIEQELYSLGVQRLVDEIRTTLRAAAQWGAMFQHVWLNSALDSAAMNDPSVRGFVGSTHNGYVDDFKRLDSTRLQLAADRVRRAHAERTIAAMNQFPEQETLIRGEAAKSRRHKPLRHIFAQATDVLTAVCPCWMASPLSVCLLIAATGTFDYVIFDEASQVLPEDAVPAILRGKHVIVAGDNKQLPPSAFFAAAEEDDEADGDATAYESLLDMMIPFVKGFHLNWHYRSRDESLISFSNHHIYDNRLVTFPGPGGTAAISHIFVDFVPTADGQEDSSGGEVEKVVELILHHASTCPGRTLGVITMGIKHASRIQGVLDREMVRHPHLAEFFDTGRRERFFVKNLERVQGDERDVIILSVGYGKNRAGDLPLRFGPILSAGGRRRLNVAATRAKEQVIVVSSFLHSDINSTQVRPGTGLEFLKNYLQYASSGGKLLSHGDLTNEPMNDFEADVYDALCAKGIQIVPQVGCSRFRIDLAALHPVHPGKFVLAIECDGATYHSSYTARDRDRLRQQQLENLGWTFHRIWSTDWFMRRDEEVERAIRAFRKAVEASDQPMPEKPLQALSVPVEPTFPTKPDATNGRTPVSAPIPVRASITEYASRELLALLRWVQSDGKLRTNDELADEMFAALPFSRRGAKIEAALKQTIQAWDRTKGQNNNVN
jgi:very-short-patch-repair endonuclease